MWEELDNVYVNNACQMSHDHITSNLDVEHDSRVKVSAAHKAQLIAIYEFVKAQNLGCTNTSIFRHCGVARRTGYRILGDAGYGGVPVPRRQSKQQVNADEALATLDDETLYRLRLWKEAGGLPSYAATWKQLALRSGFKGDRHLSWRVLKEQVATFEYEKPDQYRIKIINPDVRLARCTQARSRKLWTVQDWKKIRFSGVNVFGRLEEMPVFHCWAQVGWDFKSPLVFLNMAGLNDGKVGSEMYIHGILEPHVLPFISSDYILQEEDDVGHDATPGGVLEHWKVAHGLQFYISSSDVPELSVLKNCWRPMHHFIDREEPWDQNVLQCRLLEAWDEVSQRWINEMVLSMPQRVEEILDGGGKMTKWTSLP